MSDTFERLKLARLERAKLAAESSKLAEASYTRTLDLSEAREFESTLARVGELSGEISALELRYAKECMTPATR